MADRADDSATMTPEDAMRRMASVTSMTQGLRVRTEGLTIVIFAICMMASYLTILAPILAGGGGGGPGPGPGGGGPRPPPTAFFLSRFAPLVWYAIAALTTFGIWRGAALSFQTGLSSGRLLAVFVGWLLVFAALVTLLGFVEGSPREWHLLAWGVVIGLFATLNPLRFTKQGRVATGAIAVVALLAAAYAFTADLGGRDIGFLTGVAIGLPGLVGGLWLMYRG